MNATYVLIESNWTLPVSEHNRDIWILGSSLIKRASEHVVSRPSGSQLGLEKSGHTVFWIGYGGMVWRMVETILRSMLTWRSPPEMLIIHCGENDIPTKQNGDLIFEIRQGLSINMFLMPYSTIIWSSILHRKEWRYANTNDAAEGTRKRVNRDVRRFLHKFNSKVIHHPDLEDLHPTLFNNDWVHLSYIGNDIFINALQSALEFFISRPYIKPYPESWKQFGFIWCQLFVA